MNGISSGDLCPCTNKNERYLPGSMGKTLRLSYCLPNTPLSIEDVLESFSEHTMYARYFNGYNDTVCNVAGNLLRLLKLTVIQESCEYTTCKDIITQSLSLSLSLQG